MRESHAGLPARGPQYPLFLAARTTSTLGNWVTLTALVLYVEGSGAPATTLGALLLARALPQALGPLAGTVSDRLDGRKLMVLCDLGQAALVGSMAFFLPPFAVLVGLVALTSVLSTLFLPAGRSAVPALVGRGNLTRANALLASSSNVSFAAGPALGGRLVASFGVRSALFLDAATFLVSAALLWKLRPMPPSHSTSGGAFMAKFREGLSYVARHRVARSVGLGLFLAVAFAALDNVALVYLTRDVLGAGETGYGLALSAWAAGMILAPLLLLRNASHIPTDLVLLAGLGLTGAGLVLAGLSPALSFVFVAMAVGGSGNGLENVGTDTLIQETVPRPLLGRVFGAVYGPIFLGESLAYAAGGFLLELTSPRSVFLVAGAGVLVTLILVRAMLGRSAD